jgi:hypothetical protein
MDYYCFGTVCFVPFDGSAPKFFGFSEFLAGLALMVLAWTIADFSYKFRVRTAPLPLQGITFIVVTAVGVLTLLTDLWRAQEWLVPEGNILPPAVWQAILGGLFLLTFLTWAWFAFIRPPIYNKINAERYARTLYRTILKGSPSELAIIADELAFSAKSLIRFAPGHREHINFSGRDSSEKRPPKKQPKVISYANDILLLIADKRFCRAIVASSPRTALAIFHEVAEAKKYDVRIQTFAKNIMNEALDNRDSFLYHETEGYKSGLIGYIKPLSQAMFSNYKMVETIGTLLDPDIWGKGKWTSDQLEAYCRAVLMTFRDYVEKDFWDHSLVLYRASENIENAASDIYKLNGIANITWDDDLHKKLLVVVQFIKDAVAILEKKGVPDNLKLRIHEKHRGGENFYDHLARMIFEVIFCASAVQSPAYLCWTIQYNFVWGKLFNFSKLDGAAGRVVKFKVRRLIYDEVAKMKEFPNFKGAKILGFCLNVMGLTVRKENFDYDSKPLQKAILSWTKKNYAWLHSYNPHLAKSCLVDGMSYDAENLKLVYTSPAEGLRREPQYTYFSVDPPSTDQENRKGVAPPSEETPGARFKP